MNKLSKLNKSYINPKLANEDDEEPLGKQILFQDHLPFFESTRKSRLITAYLDENIREAKYYRPLLQVIDSLEENDILQININSYGGYLDGAVALINSLQETGADVYTFIDGVAASAASLIALASPNLSVGPYASMMIHSATFGSFGKQSDVISHASFMDKKVKKLMQDIYMDFLTEQEMEEVFMGKEIWLNSEEIIERLETRAELQNARHEAEIAKAKEEQAQQEEAQAQEAKPKRKPRVKTSI